MSTEMRRSFLIILYLLFFGSCADSGTGDKDELTGIASDYIKRQLREPESTVDESGIITIGNGSTQYVLDPSEIKTGLIDDDAEQDGVVPVRFYEGQFLVRTEHLFLMKVDGKFEISATEEDFMRVIDIKDRIIYAEISKVAPDSPTYGCQFCKEIKRYRYNSGVLGLAD